MIYNVSQLLRDPVGASRNYPIDGAIEGVDDTPNSSQVRGDVELIRTNQGILARVHADLATTEECSRCLKPLTSPLSLAFEEVFFPTYDPVTGAELPPPDEPDPFLIDHNHMLDLAPAIREYALAARPMQPLCRDDCAGLCPVCGVDRNVTTCDCAQPPADPRWATLWQLSEQE
jgi:uncharacterized protein